MNNTALIKQAIKELDHPEEIIAKAIDEVGERAQKKIIKVIIEAIKENEEVVSERQRISKKIAMLLPEER